MIKKKGYISFIIKDAGRRPPTIMNATPEIRAQCIEAINQLRPTEMGCCYFLCINEEFKIYHHQSRISKDDFNKKTDIYFVPHDTCLITGQRLLLAKQTTQDGSFEGKISGGNAKCDKGRGTCSFPSCREGVLDNKLFTYCHDHISFLFQEYARILEIDTELEPWKTHCDSNIIKILRVLFVDIEPIITRLMASPNMTTMRNFCGACEIADAKCAGENLSVMCCVCHGPCSVFEYISQPPKNYSIKTQPFRFDEFTDPAT